MNVTGLVQLHEGKRHHESDSGPLETPDDRFKHPDDTLARELQPSTSRALASDRSPMLQPVFKTSTRVSTSRLSRLTGDRSVDRIVYRPSALGPSIFCLLPFLLWCRRRRFCARRGFSSGWRPLGLGRFLLGCALLMRCRRRRSLGRCRGC